MHRGGVENGEEPEQPRVPRLWGPEEEQHGVRGVGFGHVGRPPLPCGVQVREGVGDSDQLVAGQELGTPGRDTGPTLEQGDEALASVERAVEGGQVGDLQGDNHDPDGADGDVDARVGRRRRCGRLPP